MHMFLPKIIKLWMENNGDDIDFLVEFPVKDGNCFHAPSMSKSGLDKFESQWRI